MEMPDEEEPRVHEIEKCPECGSMHLVRDYDRGELVCEDCGLVLDDQFIDQGPEWRAFDSEQGEKRARTGAPTPRMGKASAGAASLARGRALER